VVVISNTGTQMIKLFEVRIDTPVGRRMNIVVAAADAFNAREIAIGMIEDFRGQLLPGNAR
jgi:hypothetical protein